MEYIIITDTHFGHEKIKDFRNRPDNFEQLILDNLLPHATKDNILIHLGDITWTGENDAYRALIQLPFKEKWLIKGNHDKKTNNWYCTHGWDIVTDYTSLNYKYQLIVFSHKPVYLTIGDYNVHGHFHNILMTRIEQIEPELYDVYQQPGHILLALEHEYKPWLLSNLIPDLNIGGINGKDQSCAQLFYELERHKQSRCSPRYK